MNAFAVERLIHRASVTKRNNGTYFATVLPVAHRAFANGDSHHGALAALREQIRRDFAIVAHAYRIITGEEA